MTAAVEDKIVAMKFDNKQFEPAAKQTMSTLDKLKASLGFNGASKGMNDLQNTANRFSLAGISAGASGVSAKFLAMSTVAITAIANIVNRAVDAGVRIAKAFTIDPLKEGFAEYETKLGSVQTILSNTKASGASLKDVNSTLAELNKFSDKTIYNFGEMAKNIGTFTAAGVDLKTSTASIKGIANLAALSGSNSQQASSAMYQLSQAISAGRVGLQDWNSVVNAGMGGTVFQRALAQTAEKMGTLDKGAVKLTGKMKNASINGKSFRESITAKPGEESWLTSEVLTSTLKQFTGDMSDAELATMGFNAAQIKSIQDQAKTAFDAATQVKTFTQLMGTLKESAGSGWAQTFEIIVGDFEEAKFLFTEVNNVIGKAIGKSADARNKMFQDWKNFGGRTTAIEALGNVFRALVQITTAVSEAFREIFPPVTGLQLVQITNAFYKFTEGLKVGGPMLDDIKRTAKGFFAILSIGLSIVKGVAGLIGDLFGVIGENSGGFLDMTGDAGDFLVKLDQVIKKGDLVNKFFDGLGAAIARPREALRNLGNEISDFFSDIMASGNPFEGLSKYLGRFSDRLEPLTNLASKAASAWDAVAGVFKKVADFMAPAVTVIKDAFSGIGDALAKAFEAGDFSGVYDALNTGLLTGIVLMIKKFWDKGLTANIDFGGGFVEGIKNTFGALTDTLGAMQQSIQAKTILNIALAVALLTASVVALSLIDSAALTKSLTAIAVVFAQMLSAMAILTKIVGTKGFAAMPAIAAAMVLMATAVLILSAAVTVLSNLSWEELAKGLGGVAVLMGVLVVASIALSATSGGFMRAGLAMIPLAIGIKILASAVQQFANMSWGDLAKGMTALAVSLGIIAVAMALMPKGMIAQAAALLILSAALNGIGLALRVMGGMSVGEIVKGLITLAGSLIIIAAAMYAMTGALPGAAALIVAAAALAILAPVLLIFGNMKWGSLVKGLFMLAGTLAILAGGLYLMTAALPGAAALIVAAAALAILAPVLVTLGAMSWGNIVKGLVALAGVFAVIGIAALLLTPVIPAILALGAALLVLGVGVGLVGLGLMGLATAFSIFTAAGAAGVATLVAIIGLIPQFMIAFAKGILGFATTIAAEADQFVKAFVSLLMSLVTAIIEVTPKLGVMITGLVGMILQVLLDNVPRIAEAGFKLLLALLNAISNNIGKVVIVVSSIIVKFLNAMAVAIPRIIRAGVNVVLALVKGVTDAVPRLMDASAKMIIKMINGMAKSIRTNAPAMREAGWNLASAILSGMTGGLSDMAWRAASAAADMARGAFNAAKAALGINSPSKEFAKLGRGTGEGMIMGIEQYAKYVDQAAVDMASGSIDAVKDSMSELSGALSGSVDFDPTIRPILDLTQITKEATKIDGMLDNKKLSATVAYQQAVGISNDRKDVEEAPDGSEEGSGNTYVELTQVNNSPKALSSADIYLNTKSQLSMIKEKVIR